MKLSYGTADILSELFRIWLDGMHSGFEQGYTWFWNAGCG